MTEKFQIQINDSTIGLALNELWYFYYYLKDVSSFYDKTENRFKNSGFALIFNQDLDKIRKIEPRSYDIYHKFLKRKSIVDRNFLIFPS